jgi:hypothetical protein
VDSIKGLHLNAPIRKLKGGGKLPLGVEGSDIFLSIDKILS